VIVPAALLLSYGLIKAHRPLLREGLCAGFAAGVLVAIAVISWEMALEWLLPLHTLSPLADAAGRATLIAAIPEEGLKFCALLVVIRRFVQPVDMADVIVTSLGVALGFAVMENAGYVIRASAVSLTGGGVVALVRSVSAVPLHVVCGLVMGALTAMAMRDAHYSGQGNARLLVVALLLPVTMHSAYDFLLFLRRRDPGALWTFQALPLVMAASVALAIVLCNVVLRRARQSDWGASPGGAAAPATLGIFLLLVGLLMVGVMLLAPNLLTKQAMAIYCVVPLMFGLDLLWTAIGRTGRRAWA
jgi:hypothetical protein